MKTKLFKFSGILMISALALVSSCGEKEEISPEDTQDITEEAVTDSYFNDMDDMAGVAIVSDDATAGGRSATGGRSISIQDDRFNCDGIVITIETTDTSPTEPKGFITVDFGSMGCTDLRGNVRKGKITFTYSGRRFQPGSTIITTVEDYYINGVRLEGVRTITNETGSSTDAPAFRVTLDDGKATFEDATFATRESDILYQWIRESDPADDRLMVDQTSTASGVTRGGRTYEVSLLEAMEFKRFCRFAVSGIKRYLVNGDREIIIDYGEGDCDRSVTITVNGVTRNLTVNR